MKLDHDVPLGQLIQVGCLPDHKNESDKEYEDETPAFAAGWGRTSNFVAHVPLVLQNVRLNIYQINECDFSLDYVNSTTQICAGDLELAKDLCQGNILNL